MKKALPVILACAPIWGAIISAPIAAKISGPTFTTGPNQFAMVIRFLWLIAFVFLSIVPIKVAKEISEPSHCKRIEILGSLLWLPGSFLNYYIMTKLP